MRKFGYSKTVFICFCLLLPMIGFARPPDESVRGRLAFLGKTHDSSQSVWLSATTAGAFKLEAQGQQLIDTWDMSRRGIHLSLSPIVSQGNGGTHFLINRLDDRKLDSQNQKGGIIFPPFPSEPPSVMPPIVVFPEHPIIIPPGNPPSVTHPIQPTPGHPIVIPPGNPPSVTHPIQPTPGHPIVIPPGNTPSVTHPTQPTTNIPTGRPTGSNQSPVLPNKLAQSNEASASESSTQEVSDAINQEAPITEARQFDQGNAWNIWSDNYYFNSNDGRNGLDTKGTTTNFAIGADHRLATNLVFGASLSAINYNYNAFDGDLKNQANGFNIGPYFGYNISPNWSIEGSLTYGQMQNHNEIASLNSEYRTQVFHIDLHSNGLYQFGNFQLRPKPLISFTHYRNPAYHFNGMFRDRSFQVDRPQESFNFDFVELRLENNYTIETKQGNLIQPYIEPGIDYAFTRPNDGQILTGNLNLANTFAVTETVTVGIRTLLFSKAFLIDANGSYLSFGQQGLSVWELRLLASYSFG